MYPIDPMLCTCTCTSVAELLGGDGGGERGGVRRREEVRRCEEERGEV